MNSCREPLCNSLVDGKRAVPDQDGLWHEIELCIEHIKEFDSKPEPTIIQKHPLNKQRKEKQ